MARGASRRGRDRRHVASRPGTDDRADLGTPLALGARGGRRGGGVVAVTRRRSGGWPSTGTDAAAEACDEARDSHLELTTLTDGGQSAFSVAAAIAGFLNDARESLDLALYDVRLESDAGALVLASLLAAHQRGSACGSPTTSPTPARSRCRRRRRRGRRRSRRFRSRRAGSPGIPDLMHHKFCVRDGADVWTGSMNWTEDSWTRQENVVVRVLGARAARLCVHARVRAALGARAVRGTGAVDPRPVELAAASRFGPGSRRRTARRSPIGSRSTSGARSAVFGSPRPCSPPDRFSARSSRS